MRILYGVVGEGMGHAVRSRVILDRLVEQGHELLIVVSGRAHRFLAERFGGHPRVRVEQIHGLHLAFEGNAVDVGDSITENLEELPRNLAVNSAIYRRVMELDFRPRAVISDFEYWAYLFGRLNGVPVISVDNMKIIDRCRHDAALLRGAEADFRLTRLAVRAKIAWAYHYLVSSFFFPPICKTRTTLVPPILRPEVLSLRREPGQHVLIYQSAANPGLLPLLQALPHSFRVYGMGRVGQEGNVTLCPFSESAFLEDLRTARAVVAGGGYSLMGEAVHVGVPMLSVPLEGHFEQELNSRYLDQLGYGQFATRLTGTVLREFLNRVPEYERSLAGYPRQDNSYLFHCLEELLWHIERGDPSPVALSSAAIRNQSAARTV
jgi:uncharacterized protein (TIGR00661 family)